jgi:hypothetical protein
MQSHGKRRKTLPTSIAMTDLSVVEDFVSLLESHPGVPEVVC